MCIGMANGGKTPEMTDKDIIKALECCTTPCEDLFADITPCNDCPYHKKRDCSLLLGNALDLINRQQAEISEYKDKCEKCGAKTRVCIESLQNNIAEKQAEIERLNSCVKSEDEVRAIANATIQTGIKLIKSEAIKEFADRLKCKKATFYCICGVKNDYTDILNTHIDNLVKEMVGDDK